jgi:hypothetical protein
VNCESVEFVFAVLVFAHWLKRTLDGTNVCAGVFLEVMLHMAAW